MILFWQIWGCPPCRSTIRRESFSYKVDGPLDLRMNPQKGISAAQRLKEVTQEELFTECFWKTQMSPMLRKFQKR